MNVGNSDMTGQPVTYLLTQCEDVMIHGGDSFPGELLNVVNVD